MRTALFSAQRALRLLLLVATLVLTFVGTSHAETAPAVAASAAAAPAHPGDEPAADSPRAAVGAYFAACRASDFAAAARFLDLPPKRAQDGPTLARRLKLVLDRNGWIDLDTISGLPTGEADDKLAPDFEEITRVQLAHGAPVPVRLVHRETAQGRRWLFAKATVERVDAVYQGFGDRWLLDRIPDSLMRPGPFELLLWQWLAMPLVLMLAALVGLVLSRVGRAVLGRIARRTSTPWDDAWLARIHTPLTFGFTLVIARSLLPLLGLYAPAHAAVGSTLRAGMVLVVFWILFRTIDVTAKVMASASWSVTHPASRSLVPLGSRAAKAAVLAACAVAMLDQFGFPVTSLLAGLGIGGLALALAAQKTVENVFGAFSLGVDQPFREGDFVKVEDFVGTVEAIGLRSTRIRTLDRTLISVPNGKLADQRLESYTARDRLRLSCRIGLVYETTSTQLRDVLTGFEGALRAQPKLWPDNIVVRFVEFGDSSLNIDVMAWFLTQDWNEFQLIRQNVLLDFMAVVEAAGSSFAFPTRTLHIASMPEEASIAGRRRE